MITTLETLQAEALKLSPPDRSRLLERLIASLDVDQDVENAWDALTDQREAEIASGKAKLIPLEEMVARLEARFPG